MKYICAIRTQKTAANILTNNLVGIRKKQLSVSDVFYDTNIYLTFLNDKYEDTISISNIVNPSQLFD